MNLYTLKEVNKRWRIVQPDGEESPHYAAFFGKGQAERTVAMLNQPILLEHIELLNEEICNLRKAMGLVTEEK